MYQLNRCSVIFRSFLFVFHVKLHANEMVVRLCCLAVLHVTLVQAATIIYSLGTNDTWTTAGSPYQVKNSITLTPNSTLTIHGGVTVEFACDSSLTIDDANIITNGTSQTQIIFTSSRETTSCRWAGLRFINISQTSAPNREIALRGIEFAHVGVGQTSIITVHKNVGNITLTLQNIIIAQNVARKETLLTAYVTVLNIQNCIFTPGTLNSQFSQCRYRE
jgi:hypothetical protein